MVAGRGGRYGIPVARNVVTEPSTEYDCAITRGHRTEGCRAPARRSRREDVTRRNVRSVSTEPCPNLYDVLIS